MNNFENNFDTFSREGVAENQESAHEQEVPQAERGYRESHAEDPGSAYDTVQAETQALRAAERKQRADEKLEEITQALEDESGANPEVDEVAPIGKIAPEKMFTATLSDAREIGDHELTDILSRRSELQLRESGGESANTGTTLEMHALNQEFQDLMQKRKEERERVVNAGGERSLNRNENEQVRQPLHETETFDSINPDTSSEEAQVETRQEENPKTESAETFIDEEREEKMARLIAERDALKSQRGGGFSDPFHEKYLEKGEEIKDFIKEGEGEKRYADASPEEQSVEIELDEINPDGRMTKAEEDRALAYEKSKEMSDKMFNLLSDRDYWKKRLHENLVDRNIQGVERSREKFHAKKREINDLIKEERATDV